MYKPQPKTISQLKEDEKTVMQKIINGAHLDSVSMRKLTDQLADIKKQIQEHSENIKNATATN